MTTIIERSEAFKKLTLGEIQEIRNAESKFKNIGEWKVGLKKIAVEKGLTDREIIDIVKDRF